MPKVECEPTIPVFDRAKRVHALDRTDDINLIGRNILEPKEAGGRNISGFIWLRKGPNSALMNKMWERNIIIMNTLCGDD
jgi:hypothetical protein